VFIHTRYYKNTKLEFMFIIWNYLFINKPYKWLMNCIQLGNWQQLLLLQKIYLILDFGIMNFNLKIPIMVYRLLVNILLLDLLMMIQLIPDLIPWFWVWHKKELNLERRFWNYLKGFYHCNLSIRNYQNLMNIVKNYH
jgi:hypothetical protein